MCLRENRLFLFCLLGCDLRIFSLFLRHAAKLQSLRALGGALSPLRLFLSCLAVQKPVQKKHLLPSTCLHSLVPPPPSSLQVVLLVGMQLWGRKGRVPYFFLMAAFEVFVNCRASPKHLLPCASKRRQAACSFCLFSLSKEPLFLSPFSRLVVIRFRFGF